MIIIAHRGNLHGPNSEKENHPDYVSDAINEGFDVEIDAWVINNKVYLGHDGPEYEVTKYFEYHGDWYNYNGHYVNSPKLWIHCKNFEALNNDIFFQSPRFSHDKDDFTIAYCACSAYIWTYPRNLPLGKKSIAVMPEMVANWDISNAGGICTDFPYKYKLDLTKNLAYL